MSGCAFCALIQESPVGLVYSDPDLIAFLDHRPVFKGHVLLVPRQHISVFADLPSSFLAPTMALLQRLSEAVEAAMDAEGTFIALNNKISQSVLHLHFHVVPRRKGDGLRGFFWPRTKYDSEEELMATAARIKNEL